MHQPTHGTKRLNHPLAGGLALHFETLNLPGTTPQTLYIYTTESDSASEQALALLASWAGTNSGGVRAESESRLNR
jgi:hypothetical protein